MSVTDILDDLVIEVDTAIQEAKRVVNQLKNAKNGFLNVYEALGSECNADVDLCPDIEEEEDYEDSTDDGEFETEFRYVITACPYVKGKVSSQRVYMRPGPVKPTKGRKPSYLMWWTNDVSSANLFNSKGDANLELERIFKDSGITESVNEVRVIKLNQDLEQVH